ncbi:hypothetical protein MPH_04568 [Macrophomina phaseolina MS6]|uniref:BHLH domain-containing protein n=1 Tax=Macrophomina phaseolina (strain MS6) TaxID=1126212 RepID=K2S706_MACPH|nr:hypothetical protein MPH_04568 [Macrophomina phaseolina MS6]
MQLPQHPSRQPSQQAQVSTSSAPSGQVSQARSQGPDFSPYENGNQETYFSDAFYNDPNNYFLSDLEVLEPLGAVTLAGSTSDSSPENFNDVVDLTDPNGRIPQFQQSQTNQSAAAQQRQQNKPQPNLPTTTSLQEIQQNFVTAFPQDPRSAAYVEDLTFPQGPRGAAKNSVSTLETVNELAETDLTTKRNRNSAKADTLSACWTSPLCPNHSKEGTPPNPSTCGGACAPFLFANTEDTNFSGTIDSSLLTQDPIPSKESPEGVVEIQSRPRLKRSESESSREPSGRLFSKSTSGTAEPQQQQSQQQSQQPSGLKNESSPDSHSPEETGGNAQGADAGDGKGKTRRRLPHNQVERKYRESLNTQLDSLRRVVPALQQSSRGCEGGDIEDLPTPSKPSKAVVLASATAYIKQMEKDKKQLADENQLLRTRIKALQALVKCEDCSLMQYVMDLKLHNGPPAPSGCPG